MAIYIVEAKINDVNLAPDDEIAVFDGSLCVGEKTVDSAIPGFQSPLLIETSEDDGSGCGFHNGNAIVVKVWDASESLELDAVLQFYDAGSGAPVPAKPFEANGSAAIGFNIAYPPENPQILVSPASFDFGNVRVGSGSAESFSIRNVGQAQLNVEQATLTGANSGEFHLTGTNTFSLQAGESYSIVVNFSPTSSGAKTCVLTIASNDPENPHIQAPLSGRGVEPDISVSLQSLNFGEIAVNASATAAVMLSNIGETLLSLTTIRIEGSAPLQFGIESGGSAGVLAPGNSQVVSLLFHPTLAGLHQAALVVTSDDPDEPVVSIPLTGAGVENQYNLVISAAPPNGGTTSPTPGTYSFHAGELASVTAVPYPGYCFVSWQGDVENAASASTAVKMNANKTITATFAPISAERFTLTLLIDPLDGGVTVPSAGFSVHDAGSLVSLFAAPRSGYTFGGWVGDVVSPMTQNTTVVMTSDKTVTAHFDPGHVSLSLNVTPQNAGWTIPAIGDTAIKRGDYVLLHAFNRPGFKFVRWSGSIGETANPLYIQVQQSMSVTALFEGESAELPPPSLRAPASGFCGEMLDFIVDATPAPLTSLEYQFDWGDGQLSAWSDLSKQINEKITTFTTPCGQAGLPVGGHLIDYQTGQPVNAHLAVLGGTLRKNNDLWLGVHPLSGTDAFAIFNGFVDCRGAISYINAPSDTLQLIFSQLHNDYEYRLAFYSNSDNSGWDCASQVTLRGAASFVNTSSIATDDTGQPLYVDSQSPTTRLPADNTAAGYIARFDHIKPGPDGAVKLVISFGGKSSHAFKGKFANAVMLQEFQPGSSAPLFRAYNDLAWGDSFSSHSYAAASGFAVLARARAKDQPGLVSPWSEPCPITIRGCVITPVVAEGAARIHKMPDKETYLYGETVTLTAQADPGWEFSHWDENSNDNSFTRSIYANHDYTIQAHFRRATAVDDKRKTTPQGYRIEQNYPNPFNSHTDICYELPRQEFVTLVIFNVRGAQVIKLVEEQQAAGRYRVQWDGCDASGQQAPSGVYLYQFEAGPLEETHRMLLLQ